MKLEMKYFVFKIKDFYDLEILTTELMKFWENSNFDFINGEKFAEIILDSIKKGGK